MADPYDSPDPQGTPPPPPPSGPESTFGGEASTDGETTNDARTMALAAHLLGIVLSVVGPLIIWLIKKDEHPFIDDQGKEALNFQITVLIGYAIFSVFTCVTLGFGAFLFPVLWVAVVVFCVVAAVKANEGVRYRYPMTLRLIK